MSAKDVENMVAEMGSGLNPRTAIRQRADGAVNAANLDGGSSSCMYYDNEYLMTSVTFYYSNSSWRLPAGFIVK